MNGNIPIIGQKSKEQIIIEEAISIIGEVTLITKNIRLQSNFDLKQIPLTLLTVDRGGFMMAKAGVAQLLELNHMTMSDEQQKEFADFKMALEYIFGKFEDEEPDNNDLRTGTDRT